MRKFAFALALIFGLVGTAFAGDYHSGASLNCEQCHVLHGQQSHGYAADGSGTPVTIGGAAPYHYLLRNEINDLCLTCHDGNPAVIDVYGLASTSGITNGRQAGGLNGHGVAGYFDANGHTLWSTATAPGGTWSNATHGLECTDCHQQHGYGGFGNPDPYRNLLYNRGGVGGAGVSYAVGTNDLTLDVFETSASFGGDHYSPNNVDFNEPAQDASGYGAWCQGCHTDFHGNKASTNMKDDAVALDEWKRHPTADANIGGIGGGHSSLADFSGHAYRVKVMSSTGDWGNQSEPWVGAPADLTPSCFSCHKGHGNQNSFGLIHATGAVPINENGDGTYKSLCGQCHVQGG